MKTPPKEAGNARIVVWFDEPTACLCIANRSGLEAGQPIPPEKIIKLPWANLDMFVEAILNTALGESFREDADDYDRIIYGVQKILDRRAVRAFEAAEHLRIARREAAGGGVVNSMSESVVVHAGRHAKLLQLLERVQDVFESVVGPGQVADGKLEDLSTWLEDSGLSEDE